MKYSVKDIRAVGLEAKWTHTNRGAPIIVARDPNSKYQHLRETWWCIDDKTWKRAEKVGIKQAFEENNLLGNIFSIPL